MGNPGKPGAAEEVGFIPVAENQGVFKWASLVPGKNIMYIHISTQLWEFDFNSKELHL
jgi:hypothetical protein